MTLYQDDDCVARVLLSLLRRAGHDVQVPADVGLAGKSDPVHLTHSVVAGRVLMTRNYDDFEELHELVRAAGGHHPGILVIRKDNDPKRDLSYPGIVRAVAKLQASGVPVADGYHVLNHYR